MGGSPFPCSLAPPLQVNLKARARNDFKTNLPAYLRWPHVWTALYPLTQESAVPILCAKSEDDSTPTISELEGETTTR